MPVLTDIVTVDVLLRMGGFASRPGSSESARTQSRYPSIAGAPEPLRAAKPEEAGRRGSRSHRHPDERASSRRHLERPA